MLSNYPPGTWEGDPFAPWNKPDEPEEIVCPCCNSILEEEFDICPWCGEEIDWEEER